MRNENRIVNIIFDAGKGATPPTSREGKVGESFGLLPTPTKSGYKFVGWAIGDSIITADSIIESESDIRLTAKWEKLNAKERRKTVMWKQKIFAGALAFAIVFLTVAILITNKVIAVYTLKDEYVDSEGVTHTDKYKIRKDAGEYKLYDRDGNLMEKTENGYTSSSDKIRYEVYVAEASGNQYLINTSTGDYETYAVVDYDAESGESLGGTVKNKRVMMFPRVGQDNTYSIQVKNQYGEYTFIRENVENTSSSSSKTYKTTVMVKKGSDYVLASYDPTLFASLCVSCGYTLTMQKLDFTNAETPRKEDGTVDYNAYGLVDRYDENGTLTYSPAVYTIVKGTTQDDGSMVASSESYTVTVGDCILSGGGYYVQLQGRDAVYIVSSTIADTVLQPVESLVTPALTYPMSVSTYVMVYDFVFGTVADFSKLSTDDDEEFKKNVNIKVMFDYVDLEKRQDTVYSSSPYWVTKTGAASLADGFVLDNDSVSTVLGNFYELEFVGCKVLNPTDEDIKAYNLDKDIYLIRFKYDPQVASGGSDEENWQDNWVFISQKTENGTYYAYSTMYNMIVEVDQSYFSFLEWSDSHWYNKYFFQQNIAYVQEMTFKYGGKTYDFTLDNTLTYAYYDKDENLGLASGTVMNPLTGELTQLSNGNYRYTESSSGKTYTLSSSTVSKQYDDSGTATGKYIYTKTGTILDLEKGKLSEDGKTYTVTKTGKSYTVYQVDMTKTTVKSYYTSSGTKSSSVVYVDERGTEVSIVAGTTNLQISCNGTKYDYTIEETTATDTGTTETDTYSALDNFRRLYTKLLWYTIEGDVSEKELGDSVTEYVKTHTADMEIKVDLEDMATILNRENYTSNNKRSFVIRIYEYTERKALLTIEMLADKDATPDATCITKGFYVLSSQMEQIAGYCEDFINATLIPKSN